MGGVWGSENSGYGTNAKTVGAGGQFLTVSESIAALAPSGAGYDLLVARVTKTQTITATNGSPTVTGSGTNWLNSSTTYPNPDMPGAIGDLWKPAAATKYYRIKSIDSDTQFTLWENYTDTTINNASTTFSSYYINRKTLLLLPGFHRLSGVDTAMGIDISALPGAMTIVDEIDGATATPFGNLYDSNLTNFQAMASNTWGDLDGLCGSVVAPAGSEITYKGLRIKCANPGQNHQGGSLRIPGIAGSTVIYDNCIIESAKLPSFQINATRITPSVANTRVVFKNGTEIRSIRDADTNVANLILYPNALLIDGLATYDFFNTSTYMPEDLNIDPLVGNVGSINVTVAATINLHAHRARSQNTNVNGNSYCLETSAAATVNIFGSDLEATGTAATAIYNNGATINIHGSRLKGATNSINNVSGTVNVEKGNYLDGPVTGTLTSTIRGVVTLNGATPVTVTTNKVHTASRIKLSRQVAAGTMGHFGIGTITNNTSFTVVGQALDTSTVMWELEE